MDFYNSREQPTELLQEKDVFPGTQRARAATVIDHLFDDGSPAAPSASKPVKFGKRMSSVMRDTP